MKKILWPFLDLDKNLELRISHYTIFKSQVAVHT
jgi:hypothetical protein